MAPVCPLCAMRVQDYRDHYRDVHEQALEGERMAVPLQWRNAS